MRRALLCAGAHSMGGPCRNPLASLTRAYSKEYAKLSANIEGQASFSFLIAWDFPGSYIPRSFYNHLKALEAATNSQRIQKSVLITPDQAAAHLAKKVIEKFGGDVYVAPLLNHQTLAQYKDNPQRLINSLKKALKDLT